jgi:hypothetical protein
MAKRFFPLEPGVNLVVPGVVKQSLIVSALQHGASRALSLIQAVPPAADEPMVKVMQVPEDWYAIAYMTMHGRTYLLAAGDPSTGFPEANVRAAALAISGTRATVLMARPLTVVAPAVSHVPGEDVGLWAAYHNRRKRLPSAGPKGVRIRRGVWVTHDLEVVPGLDVYRFPRSGGLFLDVAVWHNESAKLAAALTSYPSLDPPRVERQWLTRAREIATELEEIARLGAEVD